MRIAKALCGRLPSTSTSLFLSARAPFCPWTDSPPLLQPTEHKFFECQYNRNKGTQCIRLQLSVPCMRLESVQQSSWVSTTLRPLMSTRSRGNLGRMSRSSHGCAVVHTGACTCPSPVLALLFAAEDDLTHPEGWCCLSLARTFASFFSIGSFAHTPGSLASCAFA